jgi:hypothetical protein
MSPDSNAVDTKSPYHHLGKYAQAQINFVYHGNQSDSCQSLQEAPGRDYF